MEKLIQGIHRFRETYFRSNTELFSRLSKGQNPEALFITCSDSRVVPDLITQTNPGDLFVIRNAGNLIPSHLSAPDSGEAATIEYAVGVLKVRDIIVCGHTGCGAMHALMNPENLEHLPRVKDWLGHAWTTREIVSKRYRCETPEAMSRVTAEENVLVQLTHLRSHPSVSAALERGDVKLHGWMFKIETGQVFAYDPVAGQFLSTEQPAPYQDPAAVVKPRQSLPGPEPEPYWTASMDQ
ncbi:carbonic anhydrase [Zavarzinella formosa]|uniref:carbonic anhydrase n=1 Tax=Zavarzinella formosa TaxID=360055 RepID=UPI0003172D59|nr:carbonic anhydrase [Zavarzinella formosa]